MIIRGQDKKTIVNLDAIESISIHNMSKYGSTFNVSASGYIIGRYSTEEKAIKVLDFIQRYYERQNKVFEMPQESEV